MAGGRIPDEAVAWYCHMRLRKMLVEGTTQKQIAEATKIAPSAINLLVKSAKGVGPSTARAFVQLLGFETRGQLTDAADNWWANEGGQTYAIREMREQLREREKAAADDHRNSSEPPRNDESGEVHVRKRKKSA